MPHCKKCDTTHHRPVGRKCAQATISPVPSDHSVNSDLSATSVMQSMQDTLQRIRHRLEALEMLHHPAPAQTVPSPPPTPRYSRIAVSHTRPAIHCAATKYTTACPDYQTGCCSFPGAHSNKGVRVEHICAWCVKMKGKAFPHRKMDCLSKVHRASTAKND